METKNKNYPFEEYFHASNITDEVKKILDISDIVVLPQKYNINEFYFAQESVNFIKYCRKNNQKLKTDILANENGIPIRALHSFDIWMPIIWIASYIILPTAIGLVTNYIYEKMKGREHEDVSVKVSFVVKSGDQLKELHYDGDAKTFKETFEKIDINKL